MHNGIFILKRGRIHGVEDILLGFEPKDAGSIPAGSAYCVFYGLFGYGIHRHHFVP